MKDVPIVSPMERMNDIFYLDCKWNRTISVFCIIIFYINHRRDPKNSNRFVFSLYKSLTEMNHFNIRFPFVVCRVYLSFYVKPNKSLTCLEQSESRFNQLTIKFIDYHIILI